MTPTTLTIKDIAKLLHLNPRTVQNMVYKQDPRIPPKLDLPGKPLWLEERVVEWLRSKA